MPVSEHLLLNTAEPLLYYLLVYSSKLTPSFLQEYTLDYILLCHDMVPLLLPWSQPARPDVAFSHRLSVPCLTSASPSGNADASIEFRAGGSSGLFEDMFITSVSLVSLRQASLSCAATPQLPEAQLSTAFLPVDRVELARVRLCP
jgi:hypothetical protein